MGDGEGAQVPPYHRFQLTIQRLENNRRERVILHSATPKERNCCAIVFFWGQLLSEVDIDNLL